MLTNYFRVTDAQLRDWCAANPALTKDFYFDQIPCEEHLDTNASTLIGWFVSPFCRSAVENESAAFTALDAEKLQDAQRILEDFESHGAKVDLLGKIFGNYTEPAEQVLQIDYGHGAASVFQPETIRHAVNELAGLSVKELRKQYLAEKPTKNEYLIWLGLTGEANDFDEYFLPNFERLREFLGRAAAANQPVVVVCTD